jgi:hypothetical protein
MESLHITRLNAIKGAESSFRNGFRFVRRLTLQISNRSIKPRLVMKNVPTNRNAKKERTANTALKIAQLIPITIPDLNTHDSPPPHKL